MTEVLRNQLISLFFDENDENSENFDDNDDFEIYCSALIICFAKNVKFFDFDYEDINNSVIVNVDRHVFYKNVYIFDDRLKNLTKCKIDIVSYSLTILELYMKNVKCNKLMSINCLSS